MSDMTDTLILFVGQIWEKLDAADSILRSTGRYPEGSWAATRLNEIREATGDLHTFLVDDRAEES